MNGRLSARRDEAHVRYRAGGLGASSTSHGLSAAGHLEVDRRP